MSECVNNYMIYMYINAIIIIRFISIININRANI